MNKNLKIALGVSALLLAGWIAIETISNYLVLQELKTETQQINDCLDGSRAACDNVLNRE